MRKIVIYPGRFHPFHKGHKGTYDYLVKKYGANNVFIASSGKQAPMTSPFSFEQKVVMMKALGVPESQIAQVKSPYIASEITSKFDKDSTVVIFSLSEKDVNRLSFKPKKDGSPSYLQPISSKMLPMSKHGYVDISPKVDFTIGGRSYDSASQIRNDYMKLDDDGRMAMIAGLYGKPDKQIKQIFDQELGLAESILQLHNSMVLTESVNPKYQSILKQIAQLEYEARIDEYIGIR
jgi:hypothetical protein